MQPYNLEKTNYEFKIKVKYTYTIFTFFLFVNTTPYIYKNGSKHL